MGIRIIEQTFTSPLLPHNISHSHIMFARKLMKNPFRILLLGSLLLTGGFSMNQNQPPNPQEERSEEIRAGCVPAHTILKARRTPQPLLPRCLRKTEENNSILINIRSATPVA